MIEYSQHESEAIGIRIARGGRVDALDEDQLLQEIISGRFDVVKLKVMSLLSDTFLKLDRLGMPWYIHSILYRNSIEVDGFSDDLGIHDALDYEFYSSEKSDVLRRLVRLTLEDQTATNYSNRFSNRITDPEKVLGAAVEYSTLFDPKLTPNNFGILLKFHGKYAGFVLLTEKAHTLEGVLYGVIPEFRGKGLAREIMKIIKLVCIKKGLKTFKNDVVFQNIPSLKSINEENILPEKSYLNITIQPLFSLSVNAKTRTEVIFSEEESQDPAIKFQESIRQSIRHNMKMKELRISEIIPLLENIPYQIEISNPIDKKENTLILIKAFDPENRLCCYGYFEYLSRG